VTKVRVTNGLYYKHITIINDPSKVLRMLLVSDAKTLSITYNSN